MAIITISRGTFGGGRAVAKTLARRLGYVCISRETIIKDAARAFNMPEDDLRNAILTAPGFLNTGTHNTIANIKFLRAVLIERARGFAMVYHGYGGHLLLDGLPCLLRIRIMAGMACRTTILMNKNGVSRKEAVRHIKDIDKKRAQWAKAVWGIDWNDMSGYDLVINMDQMKVTEAVDLIIKAHGNEAIQPDAQKEQAFENELTVSRVWAALILNPYTRPVKIRIECDQGCISLNGDVGSIKLKNAVEDIARQTHGVKRVTNNLTVGAVWRW